MTVRNSSRDLLSVHFRAAVNQSRRLRCTAKSDTRRIRPPESSGERVYNDCPESIVEAQQPNNFGV